MKTLISLFLLFFTFTCANDDDSPTRDESLTPIEFTVIGQGDVGMEEVPYKNELIASAAKWNLLTPVIVNRGISTTEINNLNINFIESDLIVVMIDPIAGSSSGIEITSIQQNLTNRIVTIQTRKGLFSTMSRAFQIVKVPKSSKPLLFKVQTI